MDDGGAPTSSTAAHGADRLELEPVEELRWRHAEPAGEFDDGFQAWIPPAILDPGDLGLMQARVPGKLLLRQTSPLTSIAHVAAKRRAG